MEWFEWKTNSGAKDTKERERVKVENKKEKERRIEVEEVIEDRL